MDTSDNRGPGRPKGSKNKRSDAYQAALRIFRKPGDTPLDVMVRVMRDETLDMALRLQAARDAAPYVHPKVATQLDVNGVVQFINPNPLLNGNP